MSPAVPLRAALRSAALVVGLALAAGAPGGRPARASCGAEIGRGGGAAYSPVAIRSASGGHNIAAGDPLPDTLTGFLTATPFSYTVTAAPPMFPQGGDMGAAAVRRQAYNLFVQDRWTISGRLSLSYGLRYEVNSTIREAKKQEAGFVTENAAGVRVNAMAAGPSHGSISEA